MSSTISQHNKRDKKNDILKALFAYINEDTSKLVYFLYKEGYSVKQVADVLDVSRQALDMKFPRIPRKGGNL